jgi:hypothetical protein
MQLLAVHMEELIWYSMHIIASCPLRMISKKQTLATECFDKILSPLCPSSELSEKLYHEIIVYAEHMVTAEESKALRKEALHSTQVADSVRKRISLTEQVSQPAGTITSPSHAVITAA